MDATYSGDWKTDAHAIDGQTGTHYDLASWVESKGFEVVADPEDMQCSLIVFELRIIGAIRGDEEATVTIAVDDDGAK